MLLSHTFFYYLCFIYFCICIYMLVYYTEQWSLIINALCFYTIYYYL